METRVSKWGNSLALRIPRPLAAEVGLDDNSPVELSLAEGKLIVSPLQPTKYSLERLLAQVTEENIHHEVDTGSAVGEEVW
jgi:antitoxin MazE